MDTVHLVRGTGSYSVQQLFKETEEETAQK